MLEARMEFPSLIMSKCCFLFLIYSSTINRLIYNSSTGNYRFIYELLEGWVAAQAREQIA